MDQGEARSLVATAAQSVSDAYWGAPQEVKETLMTLEVSLNNLLTKLNQQDLESRTEEFNTAANLMQTSIIPDIEKLSAAIEEIIQIEGLLKTALDDVVKLNSIISFFKLG